ERIERLQREHADRVLMSRHSGQGSVEGRQRVITEEKSEPRVVPRAALFVERSETVEPETGASSRANADLEREDLRGKLAALVHVAQERPEVADRIRHGLRMIGVRPSARQGLLEASARCLFPLAQALPEEAVELPDDAVAQRPKVVE